MLPPTMLAYSAPPSRTTETSRVLYDVTDVRFTPPKSYVAFRSPSLKRSVNGSWICVKSSRGPSVTAGREVVYGFARMLYASWRFHPSAFTA